MVEHLKNPYLAFYLASWLLAVATLTKSIGKNPPERITTTLVFYLITFFMPVIGVLAYPVLIVQTIQQAWNKTVRDEKLRVRRK